MAETLTSAQQCAVYDRGGKLLVSAAAGSGKTKVLVDRLISYLMDGEHPHNVDEFLIITFTKAAAAELRGKIAQKLSALIAQYPENRHLHRQIQRLHLAKISTVHSFCADILRENAYWVDVPADFRVGDERECDALKLQALEQVLEEAYQNLTEDPLLQALFDLQGYARDDREIPEIILHVFDAAQCHCSPDAWLDSCLESLRTSDLTDVLQTPWGRYLFEDLMQLVQQQILTYQHFYQLCSDRDGYEKLAAMIHQEQFQLQRLSLATTWDDVVACGSMVYERLPSLPKKTDPTLKDEFKAVRDVFKKELPAKLQFFTADTVEVFHQTQSCCDCVAGLIKLVRAFEEAYQKAKKQRRLLDYNDLEHKALDLLTGKSHTAPTAIADQIAQRFCQIMVDEYQDTNEVQDRIYDALSARKQNLFMVGDIKQSIYKFRLAEPGIFLDKYDRYADAGSAEPGQGRRVLLSSNFRSSGPVIHAVNDVFRYCMTRQVGGLLYGEKEQLNEGIAHVENTEPEVELHVLPVQSATYEEEAQYVAGRICSLLNGTHYVRKGDQLTPIKPEDIVILLRSPKTNLSFFARALEQAGIPYTTEAGEDLLETEEAVTLRAFLEVISNPLQDVPLLTVLTSRAFRFTADDLAQFRKKRKTGPVFDALSFEPDERAQSFLRILEQLRQLSKRVGPSELIRSILFLTHLDSIFAADAYGDGRVANIHAFCQLAYDFECYGDRSLDAFLEHLLAMDEEGIPVSQSQNHSGAVSILSIHKSKGLEYPVVFLSCLSKAINHKDAQNRVLCDKDLGLGLNIVDPLRRVYYSSVAKQAIACKINTEGLSEEVRILYVAMTRAKDRLIMTYADRYLEKHLQQLVIQLNHCSRDYLLSSASSMGHWILLTALQKTEAGALFSIAGYPDKIYVSEVPWKIVLGQRTQAVSLEQMPLPVLRPMVPESAVMRIAEGLNFSYPYAGATQFPAKQTATQLKGRIKDTEAADNTPARRTYSRWRSPGFADKLMTATQYGTAVHRLLQYMDLKCGADAAQIRRQIRLLVDRQLLTQQEGDSIDADSLAAFFNGELGGMLRSADRVLREFKFSILDDAEKYGCQISGEQILLQGVVDCAIIQPDGITIIDFKTDHVTEGNLSSLVASYTPQVNAYAQAMARIFQLPVNRAVLHFLRNGKSVDIL